ncbi:MAG: hypothetical protein IJ788_01920 [Oscillospiraceae bacterium]|nr:hypothetical protein [Oscillospiraceae bacterium]
MKESETQNTRVTLGDDGKYRWVYEINLFKDLRFFVLVWKIFFFLFLGVSAVVLISDAAKWGADKAAENLPFLGYFFLGMTAVVGLGYLLYAAIMGGKYIVEFEMDEKGVLHNQTAFQAKKAKKLARATMIAGAASGRIGTVGAGMNAQRTEMYSDFSKVRKIKAYPRRNLIKVNERLEHNQVYAAKEDFEFVKNYIASRCINIKQ